MKQIAKSAERKGTVKCGKRPLFKSVDFEEPVPCHKRLHTSKRKLLTTTQKIDIVHKVLVKKEMQGEVALEYRVKLYTISRLVNIARKKPQFLQELKAKEEH